MRSLVLLLSLALCLSCSAQEIIAPSTAKALSADQAAAYKQAFERDTFVSGDSTMPYRLLSPSTTPSNAVPLVILLHGSDKIGSDNEAQLGELALGFAQPAVRSAYPAYVLVPQFSARSANYHVSPTDQLLASLPGAPLLPLFGLIDKLVRTMHIDRSRIYLVGFSMGASTAWHAVLLHPELFAAAILLSPVPPDRILASVAAPVPLLICHGDADTQNPYPADLAMYREMVAAGLTPSRVRFRSYTGMDHAQPPDILDPAATWWRDWLFAQRRTQPKP